MTDLETATWLLRALCVAVVLSATGVIAALILDGFWGRRR